MSVVSRILMEDPDALYVLSGAAPYVDLSRRRLVNQSPAGTRVAVSTMRGTLETLNTSSTTSLTLHKAPNKEFTLFAWTKPLTALSTNVISFYGLDTEGIWQSGNTLNFGIRHVGGALTTATAEVDSSRGHLVFGVYDGSKVTLFVDGNEVASKEVTSSNPLDADSTLTYGDANAQALGLFGIMHRPLSGTSVSAISRAAAPVNVRTQALSGFTPSDLRIESQASDLDTFIFDAVWPSLVNGVTLEGRKILASYDNSFVSTAGSVKFSPPFVDSLNGFRISWESSTGATVKYSTDGTNFFTLYNGQTFLSGTSVTDAPIIEVSFPAGQTKEMWLSDLSVSQILSTILVPSMSNGRPVTTTGKVSLSSDYDFRKYPSLPSTFGTDGVIWIAPETEDATILTHAIEFWYTPVTADMTGTNYILDSNPTHASAISIASGKINYSGFSTIYINKVATATNVYTCVPGVPVHLVAVFTTANNTQIKLGRATSPVQGNLSSVALIRQAISAPNVVSINDNQQDVPKTAFASNSSMTLSDSAVSTFELVWNSGAQ